MSNSKANSSSTTALESTQRSDDLVSWLVILATFLLCVFPLMDTDFWWHLRTGELIWERKTVPQVDWFLFTDFDKPWIDLHWGFQLLVTGLYHLGGVNLVILVKAAVIAAAVGIAWHAVGKELPTWLRTVIWIPAIICISGRGYERPEMLSQLFLALWLWIAFRAETQPRWVWWLPVIQIVWMNCHALFVLGLVVGGCFAIDYGLRAWAKGRWGMLSVSSELRPSTVLSSGGLCALAALVNPYLWEGALFPVVLYRKFSVEQDFYSARIGEFQQPIKFLMRYGFINVYLDMQILLTLFALISFVALAVMCRRWSPFRLVLFAGFANLGWEASRNVNIFSLVAATMTVANFVEIWRFQVGASTGDVPRCDKKTASILSGLFVLSPSQKRRWNSVLAVCLIGWMALIVTGVWGRLAGEKKLFGLGERPWWFAHEAMLFVGQPGFPERAFLSHMGIAATYEYHHGPDKKVFMDPRLEVASQETFRRWEQILIQMAAKDRSWEPTWRDAQGQLPVVILDSRVSRNAINGLLQTPGWRLVHADHAAAVFLSVPQADALHLPAVDPSPLMYPP